MGDRNDSTERRACWKELTVNRVSGCSDGVRPLDLANGSSRRAGVGAACWVNGIALLLPPRGSLEMVKR